MRVVNIERKTPLKAKPLKTFTVKVEVSLDIKAKNIKDARACMNDIYIDFESQYVGVDVESFELDNYEIFDN